MRVARFVGPAADGRRARGCRACRPGYQDLLEAVCRDLTAGWTGEQAIRFLLGQGEYGLADTCIDRLRGEGLIDDAQESALREQAEAEQAAFAEDA